MLFPPAYHLLYRANFSTACVDFVQVILNLLQVGDAIEATHFEDELEERVNPSEVSHQNIRALKQRFNLFNWGKKKEIKIK